MWPFRHKHAWDYLTVQAGRVIREDRSLWTQSSFWFWRCRCGHFLLELSGRISVTGPLPADCRTDSNKAIAWMSRFIPEDERAPAREIQHRLAFPD